MRGVSVWSWQRDGRYRRPRYQHLSYLARGDLDVTASFERWLVAGNGVVLSRVSVYEFRRGVYAGSVAAPERVAGELFLVNFAVIEVDEHAWDLAAEIWGAMSRAGTKTRRMDSDILIAATALRGGYEIATRNVKDFQRIVDVRSDLVVHAW
jgi:predicted nucleic acid-binding protein